MLQNIRDNATGWMARIIVGFIIITFAFFGIQSLSGIGGGDDAVASVNGEEISRVELERAVQRRTQQLLSQMGPEADPSLINEDLLRRSVLDGLIERSIMLQVADDESLYFSDRQIDRMILATPEFQVDGSFDRDRFTGLLRNIGMTPLMFRDSVRKDVLVNQLQSGVMASNFALPQEVERLARLDRQTRDFAYLTIPTDAFKDQIEITEDEVRAYYDEHSAQFMSPEQVAIEYLLLERDALEQTIELTEEELQQAYRSRVEELDAQEERQAAHILVEVTDTMDEEAARAKLEAVKARLEQGESFAELAQEVSDDVGSAKQGGDLGYVSEGMFDPAFEAALFSLQPGEVSAPVRTDFGYHLIKVKDVRKPQVPSFDELQPELKRNLLEQRSRELFVEKSEELANISFSAMDLAEPSEVLGLPIQESERFSRRGGEGITAQPKVIEAAFSEEVLEQEHNSDLIELPDDRAVVLRVKEHIEPALKPFADVADTIKAQLTAEKAQALAKERADELMNRLESGATMTDIARDSDYDWQRQEGASRQQSEVPREIVDRAFRLPKPTGDALSPAAMTLSNGDAALVVLTDVQAGEVGELSQEERDALARFLRNRANNSDLQAYREALKNQVEVERL